MIKLDIKKFIFMAIILSIVFSAITYTNFSHNLEEIIKEQEKKSNFLVQNSVNSVLHDAEELLKVRVSKLINNTDIHVSFKQKNRKMLYDISLPILNSLREYYDIKSMHFILPNNDSFLRTHNPKVPDNNVASYKPLIKKVNIEQKILSGFEAGKQGYYYRIIYPIFYQKRYLGLVEIGLGSKFILQNIKKYLSADVAIFVDKKAIKSNY